MPTVSWTPRSIASRSLVPTPSVPATSTGSRKRLGEFQQAAEAADAGQQLRAAGARGQRADAIDQGVAGVDVDTRVAVTQTRGGLLARPWGETHVETRIGAQW